MDIKAIRAQDKKKIIASNTLPDTEYTDEEITVCGSLDTKQEILCVKYTANQELLAAGFTDGFVRIFRPEKGQCTHSLIDEEILMNPVPVTAIKHRPIQKGKPSTTTLTCTYTNGCVKCWDYYSGEVQYTIHENRQVLGLAYTTKINKFVTIGDDAKVFLYDEEAKVRESVFQRSEKQDVADGHVNRIYSACFHPKNPYEFITGGWDDTVMFWDIRKPSATRYLSGVHMCGDGIDINKTGKEILTCAWQKSSQLQIWDYATGEMLADYTPDVYRDSLLYCGKWISKEMFVAGGCDPNVLRVVDRNKGTSIAVIYGFPKGVYSADFGPVRSRRSLAKKQNVKYITEPTELPKVGFCAGTRIYEFYFK